MSADLLQVVKEILGPRSGRIGRQLDVESAIVQFNPDLVEASELLDSIMAALNNRYRADQLIVVEEEMRALKVALNEAQPYEPSAEDEAHDRSVQEEIDRRCDEK